MEEKLVSIGKSPLVGLTKLLQGEKVSAVNLHDCVDTMVRAIEMELKNPKPTQNEQTGQELLTKWRALRKELSELLSSHISALWQPDAESRIPKSGYDEVTLADFERYNIKRLTMESMEWIKAEDK